MAPLNIALPGRVLDRAKKEEENMPEEVKEKLENEAEETEETKLEEEQDSEEEVDENEDDSEDWPEDFGEEVTFDDIINSETYKSEYQKAIDREVSRAINSYKKNHDGNVSAAIAEEVAKQVNHVKFEAKLNEQLKDAGVIDLLAFKAHMDLEALEEEYNPETNSIEGLDALIAEKKESVKYLFKQDNQATGAAQTAFGGNEKKVETLSDALRQKYKVK